MKQFGFLSPTFFGIVLMSFFLSFFDLKCKTETVTTFTGLELMTGKSVDFSKYNDRNSADSKKELEPEDSDEKEVNQPANGKEIEEKEIKDATPTAESKEDFPPNPIAILAFLVAIVGFGLYFLRQLKIARIVGLVEGVLGVLLLIYLKSSFQKGLNIDDTKFPVNVSTMLDVVPQLGYYIAIFFFAAAAIWNLILLNFDKEDFPDATK